jgi:hypothetical protein
MKPGNGTWYETPWGLDKQQVARPDGYQADMQDRYHHDLQLADRQLKP